MAKPASRHTSQIQPAKPEVPEKKPEPEPAAPETARPVVEHKVAPGYRVALGIWMVVFVILMAYMILDLILGLFRK
jgi:hypothetical protein